MTLTGTDLGDTATYICDIGFRLSHGSETRVCGVGGQWSGTEPVCNCEFMFRSILGMQIKFMVSHPIMSIGNRGSGHLILIFDATPTILYIIF